jgi:hypothetical protein
LKGKLPGNNCMISSWLGMNGTFGEFENIIDAKTNPA